MRTLKESLLVAATVPLLMFLAVPTGLAQVSTVGFAGRWLQDLPLSADGQAPKFVLHVTNTAQTLIVEEFVGESAIRRPSRSYRLNAQVIDRGIAEFTTRTFRWLAVDRLEFHDLAISPKGEKTAVTALWELRDGGRQLRIRRILRSLDDSSKQSEARVSTYRRIQ